MSQLDRHEARELHVGHEDVAWTLHTWHEALLQIRASVEVDLYACGMAVVMEQLGDCHTLADLVTRFQAPDDRLVDVLIWFCWKGEILLRPQLLLGASCALRLHDLIAETIA
jgi:hypothetical protein